MRGCLLSNSHITAIKQAWDADLNHDIGTLDFFAAKSHELDKLVIEDSCLVARDDDLAAMLCATGGSHIIDIRKYDYVLIHALYFGVNVLARTLVRFHPYPNKTRRHISLGALAQAAKDEMVHTLAVRLVARIKQVSQVPIMLSTTPVVDERVKYMENEQWKFLRNVNSEIIENCFFNPAQDLARELGLELIRQPSDTLVNGVYTSQKYSVGSATLKNMLPTDSNDFVHMNAAYGAIVISGIRNILGAWKLQSES